MRVLFLHQNWPGQFSHLARALAQEGQEVRALAISPRQTIAGVDVVRYAPARNSTRGIAPWAIDFETKTIRAEASARKMAELDADGFVPDIVVGHHGWGETWLVKDVWPDVPLLCLKEFYYGADLSFDPEFPHPGRDGAYRFRLKNFGLLPALDTMDWGMSPTAWQRAQFPERYRSKMSVAFEGIDANVASPKPIEGLTLGTPPVTLGAGDEIVSFVSRALEPYRGYHSFMRALPRLLELRPRARVVIVGGDANGYGAAPSTGTWREKYLAEVRDRIDLSRVHFVGKVAYGELIDLFRITSCHVYLTYPFVLSWSMLEAMSTGALVVGSRTGPVEDVLVDGDNGLLVDFFDPDEIAERVAAVLAEPGQFAGVRTRARQTVLDRFALDRCVPKQVALVHAVARGELPPVGF
ncbi:MAG TPA: glycosyltransferase [Polyangiaceae bacterium]|nr:glycosyltransferase [Polyangiaceae bacterium]